MKNISELVNELVSYGVKCGLTDPEDAIYARNRLLEVMGEDEYTDSAVNEERDLEVILSDLLDAAAEKGLLTDNTVTYRDLFDTKLMACLTPLPSSIVKEFNRRYSVSKTDATDWFYKMCCDSDYIRRYRIKKDKRWKYLSKYGELDITINLSKPEKDPKAIAAALNAKQSAYPKCQLCVENTGYAGRVNHPARQTIRTIPLNFNGEEWRFQYSPYVYYNEHCIVFCGEHRPMKISKDTFSRLLSFEDYLPHYFIGSNADLPIVGGSILTHDHFQGGHYTFAMEKAEIEKEVNFKGFEDIKAGIVKWPLSVIRISGKNKDRLVALADKILTAWRGYTDKESFIFAETDGTPHNTITPIARMRDGAYELDLVLRNNITTDEHPLGVYHPHAKLHHIKKENIGLIEVMGLAVLPSRLVSEMDTLAEDILKGSDIAADEKVKSHAEWINEIKDSYEDFEGKSKEEILDILKAEIGKVFEQVLEDAGVYKCDKAGREGFDRFVEYVNK